VKNLKTISEAAKILNVSSDTLRRWDKKGIIKSFRSDRNFRLFDVDEINRVRVKKNSIKTYSKYKLLKSKPTNYTVIELFAGAGGTALGFHNAGLQHIHLSDFDKDAVKTLKNNFGDSKIKPEIIQSDIKVLNDNGHFDNINADVIEGGFPCQAFSYAGKKMGFKDSRGTLFYEFARCIKKVKPKVVIGENVRGLHRHDNGKTLKVMINTLRELGYKATYTLMRSQFLDVPQKRERIIIYGIREDLNLKFLRPIEKNYTVSLREALKNCPASQGQLYPERKKEILSLVPEGGYWRDLPVDIQKEYMQKSYYMGGGKTGMARRLSWNEPSLTILCSPAQKQTERCHPEETRPLTIRENARIQMFPDNWSFAGSVSSQYKQIGNAVPVNLAYHIGRCVIMMLQKRKDESVEEFYNEVENSEQLSLF